MNAQQYDSTLLTKYSCISAAACLCAENDGQDTTENQKHRNDAEYNKILKTNNSHRKHAHIGIKCKTVYSIQYYTKPRNQNTEKKQQKIFPSINIR